MNKKVNFVFNENDDTHTYNNKWSYFVFVQMKLQNIYILLIF